MSQLRGVMGRSGRLSVAHEVHALAIVVLPALAVCFAIYQGIFRTVNAWELELLFATYFITMLGVTVGLHRMLSHRSFEACRSARIALSVLGAMAAQGPPVYWAANHRRHHAYTDLEGDLHSPHRNGTRALTGWRGLWHAHVGWTFKHKLTNTAMFGKDLLQDRDLTAVNRHYYMWVCLGLLLPGSIGWLCDRSAAGFLNGILWGGAVRIFVTFHLTAAINSIAHVSGYRRFMTHESSRNNVWFAVPTLGETWHNNHHARPGSARFGVAWWEFDVGWIVIKSLHMLGAIKSVNVRDPLAETGEVERK